MKFKDENHEKAYYEYLKRARVNEGDLERKSLFYILALFRETRNHINQLYDFDFGGICIEGLQEPWQTGGTTKATKLAFNLYNGYRGEGNEDYTPLELFSVSGENREYLVHGLELRFNY